MIYFISGHRNLSYEDFKKYYIPAIENVINKDKKAEFVVGDCDGVDKYAMDYIYKNYKEYCELTIHHMLTFPRNTPLNKAVDDFDNYKNNDQVYFKGGFHSDIERDSAMTSISDIDIAFVKDNRWDSGTAQNIKRRCSI